MTDPYDDDWEHAAKNSLGCYMLAVDELRKRHTQRAAQDAESCRVMCRRIVAECQAKVNARRVTMVERSVVSERD